MSVRIWVSSLIRIHLVGAVVLTLLIGVTSFAWAGG
jgi:hypothetical protein